MHSPTVRARWDRRCAGGKARAAEQVGGEGEETTKRVRTNIPKLAANFIDSFLPQYNSHHGEARINLIKETKKAMDAAEPTWALTPKVIDTG